MPQIRKYGVASIRVCFSGGSTLPVEVQESFEKLSKGRVVEAYQTVEAGICLANPLAARKRSGSIGVPLPGIDVRLLHPGTGALCGDDETGEMWVLGPQVSSAYWQLPKAADPAPALALKAGWFATGDLARRDADGFFYLVERQENVIHGQAADEAADIYPREIEEVLYELQEVSEAAVTSWVNDDGDLEIVAFIVPDSAAALDIARLQQWCLNRLPPESRPTRFVAIERLPRSPTGKLLRRALRDLCR